MKAREIIIRKGDDHDEALKKLIEFFNHDMEGTKSVSTAKVPDNREGKNLLAGETKAKRVEGSI